MFGLQNWAPRRLWQRGRAHLSGFFWYIFFRWRRLDNAIEAATEQTDENRPDSAAAQTPRDPSPSTEAEVQSRPQDSQDAVSESSHSVGIGETDAKGTMPGSEPKASSGNNWHESAPQQVEELPTVPFAEQPNNPNTSVLVLVINYGFENSYGRDRHGNDADLRALRRLFSSKKNCRVEFISPLARDLREGTTLSEDGVKRIFGADCEVPSLFVLFVLSHGREGGLIETDTLEPQPHFNVAHLFNALKANPLLSNALKLLFLGPCRGSIQEMRSQINEGFGTSANGPAQAATEVQVGPDKENFVVFYSTMETCSSNRLAISGTLMVSAFVEQMNALFEKMDVVDFLTLLVGAIIDKCDDTVRQTPQFDVFPHTETLLCPPSEPKPKAVCVRGKHFYSMGEGGGWKPVRRALIFWDNEPQFQSLLDSYVASLAQLGFQVHMLGLENVENVLQNVSTSGMPLSEGWLLVFVFAPISDNNGVKNLILKKDKMVTIGQLTFLFTGDKCSAYAEKPRIFFFLSHKTLDEDLFRRLPQKNDIKEMVHSCSGYLVCVSEDKDFIQQLPSSLLNTLKPGSSLQQVITQQMQKDLQQRKNLWSTCPTQVTIKDAGEERPPPASFQWGSENVSVDKIVASEERWIELKMDVENREAVDELLAMLILKRRVVTRHQFIDKESLTTGGNLLQVEENADPILLLVELEEGLDVEKRILSWPIMDNNKVIFIQPSSNLPSTDSNKQIIPNGPMDSRQASRKTPGAMGESCVQTYLRVSYQSKEDLKPTIDILHEKCKNIGQLSEAYDELCEMIEYFNHHRKAEVLLLWYRATKKKTTLKNEEKLRQWSKFIIKELAGQVPKGGNELGKKILQLDPNLMNFMMKDIVDITFNGSVERTKTLLNYSKALPLENQHELLEKLFETINRHSLMKSEHALHLFKHSKSTMTEDQKSSLKGSYLNLPFDPIFLLNVYTSKLETPMHSIIPDLVNLLSPHNQNVWQKLLRLQQSYADKCSRLTLIQCLLMKITSTDSNDAFYLFSQAHHISKEAKLSPAAGSIAKETLKMLPESFKILLEGNFRCINDDTLEPPIFLEDVERVFRIDEGKYRYNQTWRAHVDQESGLVSFSISSDDKELFLSAGSQKNNDLQLVAAANATLWKIKALDSRKLRVSFIDGEPRSFEWSLKQMNDDDDPLKMAAEQMFKEKIEPMNEILKKHNLSLRDKGTAESIFQHVCSLSVESAFSFVDHCDTAFHEDLYKTLTDLIEGKDVMPEQEKLLLLIVRLKQNDFDFMGKNTERLLLGGDIGEKIATIVSKCFSGTFEELLRLLKFSRLLAGSGRCFLIHFLFKELEQRSSLDSQLALHLWSHAKYSLEEDSWTSATEAAQSLCIRVLEELIKREDSLIEHFTPYVNLLVERNVEGLDASNPQLWIIMVEYISHCYRGDLATVKHLIEISRRIPDYLVVALTLQRLYQEMQKKKQADTFEAFSVFNEVKRNMTSSGYRFLPPGRKELFEKIKNTAPACVKHILWPHEIYGFSLTNSFSNQALSVDKWTQKLCLNMEQNVSSNLWLADVDADTALVAFKHVDTDIKLKVSNNENSQMWKVRVINDSSVQVYMEDCCLSNYNIDDSQLPDSDEDEKKSTWEIKPLTREIGRPIQVVSTNKNHTFTLNEEALQKILAHDKIKDLPVVVVSVAGAYRKGKSFLLNFFIRYLEAQGKGEWLGSDDVPLEGFHWKGGCDADTSGILMWSIPYVVALPTGEKVAVILMDTQGAFDSDSTMNDCATIFALSTMVSSVQVYNISQNIQENDLTSLQVFAEYGKLAMTNSDFKPFQKLYFLVRDWTSKEQYKYGSDGGKQLLDKRLQIKEDHHPEQSSVRKSIKSCFEELSCFLMPHPGLDFVERTDSQGRTQGIRTDFKSQLGRLVPELLAPENLIAKKISNKPIKAKELFSYFTSYMTLFSAGNIPQVQSIFEATVEAKNRSAVAESEEMYHAEMEKRCQSYLKQKDMVGIHEILKEVAMDYFQRQPKLGGKELSERFVPILAQQIEKVFSDFSTRNNQLKADIEEKLRDALEKALETYRNDMKNMLRKKKVLSEAKLSLENEKIRRKALDQFQQSSELADEEISTPYLASLTKELDDHIAALAVKNKRALEVLEERISFKVQGAEKSCRLEMQKLLRDENKLPTRDQFKAEHQSILEAALSKFKQTLDTLCACEDISAKYLGEFQKQFDSAYVDLEAEHTKARDSNDKKNRDLVANVNEVYCSEMQQLLAPSKPLLDEQSLEAEHVRRKSNAREMLKSKLITIADAHNDYLAMLDTEIESSYLKLKNDHKQARELIDLKNRDSVSAASEEYRTEMGQLLEPPKPLLDEEALGAEHRRMKSNARQMLKDKLIAIAEAPNDYLQMLDAEIEKQYAGFNAQNKLAWALDESNCNLAVAKAKEHYDSKMNAILPSDKVLCKEHSGIKASAIELFKEQLSARDAAMVESALERLEQDIDIKLKEFIKRKALPVIRERTKIEADEFVEAAKRGDLDLLKAFLPLVESVDVRGEYERTALMWAAEKNHVECIRFLLEKGADPNQKDSWGETSLDLAAWGGAAECFYLLFDEVDAENRNLERLMHYTAMRGKAKELQFLIEKGAKLEVLDGWEKNTCLHNAAQNENAECLEFLLKNLLHEVDVNAKNVINLTALHLAAWTGGVANLQLLVQHGADATATDEDGRTALHYAVRFGRVEKCEFLSKYIPIDSRDKRGITPLMRAAGSYEEGAPRVIEFLLEKGADPKLQNRDGKNCLHIAACYGRLENVKVLCECDRVPLEAKTKMGETALQLAEEENYTEVAAFLRAKNAERAQVAAASQKNSN